MRRSFELVSLSPKGSTNGSHSSGTDGMNGVTEPQSVVHEQNKTVLEVAYAATTNRMLRVAVNGFFESLGLVVHVMEDCDEDVVMKPSSQRLEAVQGLEEVRRQG